MLFYWLKFICNIKDTIFASFYKIFKTLKTAIDVIHHVGSLAECPKRMEFK